MNTSTLKESQAFADVGDWIGCPQCHGPVVRHLFYSTESERLFTYHCQDHGDVVPKVKERPVNHE